MSVGNPCVSFPLLNCHRELQEMGVADRSRTLMQPTPFQKSASTTGTAPHPPPAVTSPLKQAPLLQSTVCRDPPAAVGPSDKGVDVGAAALAAHDAAIVQAYDWDILRVCQRVHYGPSWQLIALSHGLQDKCPLLAHVEDEMTAHCKRLPMPARAGGGAIACADDRTAPVAGCSPARK